MKTLCLILMLVAAPMCHAADEAVVFQYPPTVDNVIKCFSRVLECAAEVGAQPYDIHIASMSTESLVLKLQPSFFAPFVRAASKLISPPLLEYRKFGGTSTATATFSYILTWPTNEATVLDEQLRLLVQKGMTVEKPAVEIVVISAGSPVLPDLFKLMEYSDENEAKRNANPPK